MIALTFHPTSTTPVAAGGKLPLCMGLVTGEVGMDADLFDAPSYARVPAGCTAVPIGAMECYQGAYAWNITQTSPQVTA